MAAIVKILDKDYMLERHPFSDYEIEKSSIIYYIEDEENYFAGHVICTDSQDDYGNPKANISILKCYHFIMDAWDCIANSEINTVLAMIKERKEEWAQDRYMNQKFK